MQKLRSGFSQAIIALKTRKNTCQNKITEEFCVPVQQL